MCAHIKSSLMDFNKIKFSKRASLFDGKLCLTKKWNSQSVLSRFFYFKNKHTWETKKKLIYIFIFFSLLHWVYLIIGPKSLYEFAIVTEMLWLQNKQKKLTIVNSLFKAVITYSHKIPDQLRVSWSRPYLGWWLCLALCSHICLGTQWRLIRIQLI